MRKLDFSSLSHLQGETDQTVTNFSENALRTRFTEFPDVSDILSSFVSKVLKSNLRCLISRKKLKSVGYENQLGLSPVYNLCGIPNVYQE